MSGHFVRDIAVLVLVFVPLDIWKHNEVTANRLVLLGIVSLVVFGFGLALHWVSSLVKWARGIWEEENMEMNEIQILRWLVIVVASFTGIAIAATLLFLQQVRLKVREHRHVRRIVSEASQQALPFGQQQPTR
jgi:heme/copper-type cytochrome/quinol oxidase subunit 1